MRWLLVTLVVAGTLSACSTERGSQGGVPTTAGPSGSAALAPIGPQVPEARTEVGAGRLGDRVLVVGGLRADGSATDRVDVFDLAAETWSSGPPLPVALHHVGAASFRGRLVVAGGYTSGPDGLWIESDRVWSLGDDAAGWVQEPSMHTRRGALGLAATDDRLLAFGGTSSGRVLDTVELLVAGADAWRAAPSMGQAREHLAATSVNGRVYAIAGRVGGLETNLGSVESIQPGAFAPEWRPEPALSVARGGTAAASARGRVCVVGGEAPSGTIAEIECLVDGRWTIVGRLSTPRHGLGVVAGLDGALHILAGGPEPGLFVSAAHEIFRPS